MSSSPSHQLRWRELPVKARDALTGKLVGLWGAVSDETAFDSLTEDKQQALLLLLTRMQAKDLWHLVRSIDNVYGKGGVGLAFAAWPSIQATLSRRKDFTRLFANHKDTSGGFYEKGRAKAVLHFLFQEGSPRKWYVHFDLYSPVHSFSSARKHLRHEFLGKISPDWKMIKQCLKA
ncbi:MAG: hypothetical protein M3410_04915 [Acidobacteriota bacterium]|nr:hypothetical protein [Acidobacteriota bacterium]